MASAPPRGDELESLIEAAASDAQDTLGEYWPFLDTSTRRTERSSHPFGQEAFLVEIQFPWHRSPQRKIRIAVDEPLALAPETRPLLHRYGESLIVGNCSSSG